ncbi:ORF83 [Betabaculovirus altermyunipunctae]|uniref:ORF83 n=1 Tax=Betabaculovirus altermyunipunctae TaxID=3051996 RepID=A0A1S5YDZ2_9BBAC|nr:ORF83 [Betabaculovirus altermyunipunctae]AQQ80350.1 ORF83 [Betabaculovirus altermyunipunctae]
MWTDKHERVVRKLAADHYFQDVMEADVGPPRRHSRPRLYPDLRCVRFVSYDVSDRYCRRIMRRMHERYRYDRI